VSSEFLKELENWIKEEQAILEMAKSIKFENKDRLDLILSLQAAFRRIMVIAKGFENWLQNPYVTIALDQDILKTTNEKVWNIMIQLLEADIEHTQHYINLAKHGINIEKLLLIGPKKEPREPYFV